MKSLVHNPHMQLVVGYNKYFLKAIKGWYKYTLNVFVFKGGIKRIMSFGKKQDHQFEFCV